MFVSDRIEGVEISIHLGTIHGVFSEEISSTNAHILEMMMCIDTNASVPRRNGAIKVQEITDVGQVTKTAMESDLLLEKLAKESEK